MGNEGMEKDEYSKEQKRRKNRKMMDIESETGLS